MTSTSQAIYTKLCGMFLSGCALLRMRKEPALHPEGLCCLEIYNFSSERCYRQGYKSQNTDH